MGYDEDKAEPLVGYYWQGKYTVFFNRNIYDDYRDGWALSDLVPKILSPEKFDNLRGLCDMGGYFVKDGIRVEMVWSEWVDYYWQADTDIKDREETVFAWAELVQREYLRLNENIDEIKPLIVTKCFERTRGFVYTLGFNKYVYDCDRDSGLLCETVRALLLPEEFRGFDGSEDMQGYFVKDGIKVEMHGIRVKLYDKYMLNFYWQADTADDFEKMIVFDWAEHIKNEYPKVKRSFSLSNKTEGKVWSWDTSEAKKKYRPVAGYDINGKYIVVIENYKRNIYNDPRDGITFNEIIHDLLCPEEDHWSGEDKISGYFIKDNIRVNTDWGSRIAYSWEADADNEEIRKKLLEWAIEVHKVYLKLYLKSKGKTQRTDNYICG